MESSISKLTRILETNPDDIIDDDMEIEIESLDQIRAPERIGDISEFNCVECVDMPGIWKCEACDGDLFCAVCYRSVHRAGSRKKHSPIKLFNENEPSTETIVSSAKQEIDTIDDELVAIPMPISEKSAAWFQSRAKYVPIRLEHDQRIYLRLGESALYVSEYTDKVDILTYSSKGKRMHQQIKILCAILSGLATAADYKKGQKLFATKDFSENDYFFQDIFEICRRYKVMNPDRMRDSYGKLLYCMQDSRQTHIEEMLGFSLFKPLVTVSSELERFGIDINESTGNILSDPLCVIATATIPSTGRNRREIQRDIKQKENARKAIIRKYARSEGLTHSVIEQLIYSMSDANSFLEFNRDPVIRMRTYLEKFFTPEKVKNGFSLAIRRGVGGSRLSHDHKRQYHYARQTLMLWEKIIGEFYRLWILAEDDLLDPHHPYRLTDTGQGLQRVQQAPKCYRAMVEILSQTQAKVGDNWVGSSVIHMGDAAVPNSFIFLDKYTQVPRIIGPIVKVLDLLPSLEKNKTTKKVINEFGGVEKAQNMILCDFFKHALDGNGSDSFFMAGSCIDGRLTSAWEWTNTIEKKPYFPLFLLCGFIGFDGEFKS